MGSLRVWAVASGSTVLSLRFKPLLAESAEYDYISSWASSFFNHESITYLDISFLSHVNGSLVRLVIRKMVRVALLFSIQRGLQLYKWCFYQIPHCIACTTIPANSVAAIEYSIQADRIDLAQHRAISHQRRFRTLLVQRTQRKSQ